MLLDNSTRTESWTPGVDPEGLTTVIDNQITVPPENNRLPDTDTDSSDDSYESSDHGYALDIMHNMRSQHECTSSSEQDFQSSDPDVEAEMQILFDGVEAAATTMKAALENDV